MKRKSILSALSCLLCACFLTGCGGEMGTTAVVPETAAEQKETEAERTPGMTYETLSTSGFHTVGVKSDGTVVAVGPDDDGECNVSVWTDVVAVSTVSGLGGRYTLGLKSDGTVLYAGSDLYGQRDIVTDWTDIVAVSGGTFHIVGLKSDGTVVAGEAEGDIPYNHEFGQCNVSDWTDIVAVSAGECHTVGLKSDGTVVAVGSNSEGACDVSDWTDIVAISAGAYHTVGLKSDGTVVAAGMDQGECNVSAWADIAAISAGKGQTIGIKSDGSVVVATNRELGKMVGFPSAVVSNWTDMVAVSIAIDGAVGLKSDGTVVVAGAVATSDGTPIFGEGLQWDVSGWTDIKMPEKK